MKLAIVAYPSLDEDDRQWIERFRAKHDPQALRLGVHFTLVFPVDAAPTDIAPEVEAVAGSAEPISFVARGIDVVRDVLGHGSHIFLVPDEGRAQFIALHERLYAGALKPHLRSDIPFVPHMTVGAADAASAERAAEELRLRFRIVRGTIGSLEVVDVGPPRVRPVAAYALGSRAGRTGR